MTAPTSERLDVNTGACGGNAGMSNGSAVDSSFPPVIVREREPRTSSSAAAAHTQG